MSEENTTPPPPAREPGPLDLLLKDSKPEKLKVLETVRAAFVQKSFNEEVQKVTPLLDAGVKLFLTTRSELRKLKESPDVAGGKSLDGAPLTPPSYSDKMLKAIRDKEEQLIKIVKALDLALTTGDFSKVTEVTKGGKNDGGDASK